MSNIEQHNDYETDIDHDEIITAHIYKYFEELVMKEVLFNLFILVVSEMPFSKMRTRRKIFLIALLILGLNL